VLVSKVKIRIFEEAVHEHDKLAHAGYQSDFWFFAVGPKTDVESFEHGSKRTAKSAAMLIRLADNYRLKMRKLRRFRTHLRHKLYLFGIAIAI
jgi:hypothetical protein